MNSFVALARAESFGAAGRETGHSGSYISRHVRGLEDELGIRLVHRTARSVSLTEQGQRYFEFARRWLSELEIADASIRCEHERAAGPLAIVSPKWIGSLDLADAVAAFANDHPEILVRFDVGGMSERTHDFINQGYDIAFHTKRLRDSAVKIRQVATLPFVLCASPTYLRRGNTPAKPRDLLAHRCLTHHNEPVWHLERDGRAHHHRVPAGGFSSNTYLVLSKATLEGLGVAQLPLRLIFEELRDGRLQIVLPDYAVPSRPLFIVYPPGLQSMRKFRVFLDYIADWFKRFPTDERTGNRQDQPAVHRLHGGNLAASA